MKNRKGKRVESKFQKNGKPVMVGRIFFFEPELLDLLDRVSLSKKITRSTMVRQIVKDKFSNLNKIKNIDWSETYI